MYCAHCQGAEEIFGSRMARRELRKYQTKGPGKTTRLLVEAIKSANVEGATLLDIGGGVGAIENELLEDGVQSSIDVDASSAYLEAAARRPNVRGTPTALRTSTVISCPSPHNCPRPISSPWRKLSAAIRICERSSASRPRTPVDCMVLSSRAIPGG